MCESSDIVNDNFENKSSTIPVVEKLPHHEQLNLCETRPPYRQGRKLTAVKVYTVNDESKYLIISGIPDIKISTELSNMCLRFGKVQCLYPLPDYPSNRFELTYLVKYAFVRNARRAKQIIDGKSFFGGVLHVCYAPELESLEETKEKLIDRRNSVAFQMSKLGKNSKKYIPTNLDLDAKKRIVDEMSSIIHDRESITFEPMPTIPCKIKSKHKLSPQLNDYRKKFKAGNESCGSSQYISDKLPISSSSESNNESCDVEGVYSNQKNSDINNSSASIATNINEKHTFTPFKVKSLMLSQPSMDYLKKPISLPTDDKNRTK